LPFAGGSVSLAASLLEAAGLGPLASAERFGHHSNEHHLVGARDGGRYVLRRFQEQALPHTALVRMRRERWCYDVLARAGAPVPRVLAFCEEPGAEAILTTFVDGEHLGTAIPRLPEDEARAAWASCGRTLALAHSIDAAQATAAGCEQAGILDTSKTRGPWHHQQALLNLDRLERARPDLQGLGDLRDAVDHALPLYERAPLALCQCDAHLWQFLVARDPALGWTCSGILDWEDADLDDPDCDLARLDGFRWTHVDLVPDAFFAGYGRIPTSPLRTLYRLELAAWILAEHTKGTKWVESSVPLAERLVVSLLARPEQLGETIDQALLAQ
jgi:aminoglycoside phosphotransferase (APT) family kinase protein